MSEEKKITEEEKMEEETNENGTSANNNNNNEEGNQGNNSGDNNKESQNGNNKDNNSKGEKTFTQNQVNAMMTKEKKQGRNSAFNELGIDPKDEKQLAMVKAFLESQKTDEDKKAEEEKDAFERERKLAIAETKVEIMKQGVKPQYVDDAVSLVLSQLDEDTDVKTVLNTFKSKYPIWFETENDDKNNIGNKGTGSSVKGDSKGSSNKNGEKSMGARLAAQRKGKSKKSSYWN